MKRDSGEVGFVTGKQEFLTFPMPNRFSQFFTGKNSTTLAGRDKGIWEVLLVEHMDFIRKKKGRKTIL